MFRRISGRPQVRNLSFKYVEEEVYITLFSKTRLNLLKLLEIGKQYVWTERAG
jgi:hypothetical protein